MQRILVLQLKRIGDFILTIPALGALREAYPQAEIVLLTTASVADLAACLPMVNRVVTYTPGRLNLKAWGSALAGPWDACLDFTGTDRSASFASLSRARQRLGYEKFTVGRLRQHGYTALCAASVRDLHTVDFHLALVELLLGSRSLSPARPPLLVLPGKAVQRVRGLLQEQGVDSQAPFAIIHPGTAREEKFWLDERWAQVAQRIQGDLGLPIVLTGSGVGLEAPHLERLQSLTHGGLPSLAGRLSLVEQAAAIQQCTIIAGVDSMAMHLASLFRKPQVALFGPTNPYHWRSRHDFSLVLQGAGEEPLAAFTPRTRRLGMNQISTDAVMHAIEYALATRPAESSV